MKRFLSRALLVLPLGFGVALAQGSCVIADPPADLPRLPLSRPTVVRGSVVPSPNEILTVFPAEGFVVWVELSDPELAFQWAFFADYNPITGAGLNVPVNDSKFSNDPAIQQGRLRKIVINAIPLTDRDQCHVLELVVALEMEGTTSAQVSHTPKAPGGDSVTWFYNPSGDLRGCPSLDAGAPPFDGGEGGIP